MSIVLKPKITVDDFKGFDEQAAERRAVARAIDLGRPMPYSFRVKANRARSLRKLIKAERTGARSVPHSAAVGCHSSTLFPSGSINQPKRP